MNQNLSLADTMRPTSEDLKKLRGKLAARKRKRRPFLALAYAKCNVGRQVSSRCRRQRGAFYRCVATVCPRTSSSRKMAPPDLGISTATRYGTPLSKVISSTYSLSLAR